MKKITIFIMFLLFALATSSSVNAYNMTDSVLYSVDKHIPSFLIIPAKDKKELSTQRGLTTPLIAQNALKRTLKLGLHTDTELQFIREDSKGNQHIAFTQLYKGIKVNNSRAIVHYRNNFIDFINGNFRTIGDISTIPTITESEALKRAISFIDAKNYMWEDINNEKWLKEEQSDELASYYPKGELVIFFNEEDKACLTYKFDIYASYPLSRDFVFVNAVSGNIEGKQTLINEQGVESVYRAVADTKYSGRVNFYTRFVRMNPTSSGYYLLDSSRGLGIHTLNMKNVRYYDEAINFYDNDNNWTHSEWHANGNIDGAALDAHWGAMVFYDYFKQQFNRNSFDNQDAKMVTYVNADLTLRGYRNSDNAFWDGYRVTVGKGTNFSPLTPLDSIAHEYGHALTRYTAGLIYSNESGAISESLSDFWGVCIENHVRPHSTNNWIIGESVVPEGLRNMKNPKLSRTPQPNTYLGENWYSGTNDNGGVHYNSGPLNYFFYLLSNGGTGVNDNGYRYSVTGIGLQNVAKIIYHALTHTLYPDIDYTTTLIAILYASMYQFGMDHPYRYQVQEAGYAIGIGNPPSQSKGYVNLFDLSTQKNQYNMSVHSKILNIFTGSEYDFGTTKKNISYSIYNQMNGLLAKSGTLPIDGGTIDLISQPAGIYILRLNLGNNLYETYRFLLK